METGCDCLICFLRQTLATLRHSTEDPSLHWRITAEVGAMLADFDPRLPPPVNAVLYYRHIAARTGVADPFHQEKAESTAFALAQEASARELIRRAPEPLDAAIRLAIQANVLDFGAQVRLDREKALTNWQQPLAIDHFAQLDRALEPGASVLYLADNCGEIVFDKLVIEILLARGCRVTAVVRGAPIINDATLADARICGLEGLCPVIDNGTDLPGTWLDWGSEALREAFARADCIVSKGMGNFECLSDVRAPIFFLFTVKCTTVLAHLRRRFPEAGLAIASPVLIKGQGEGG